MDRKQRTFLALGLVSLLLGIAAVGLGTLNGGPVVQAAPPARPVQQGVQASGIITLGTGTCFPDAVLKDCDGNVVRQLKGPGGSGFFAPYYDQWVELDGAEMTCVAGDTYIQVVNIQAAQNPCPGQGTPTTPPPPGSTATATATFTPVPPPGATATPPLPPGATPTVSTTVPINLALGKAVQASSAPDPAHPPEHAVDGDPNSWWASIPDPQPVWHVRHVQWIYVDLGADYDVDRMRMLWSDQARPRKYAIYNWVESYRGWNLVAWTESGKADDPVQFPRAVEGRYFMLWLEIPYVAGSHYELREWEVFGPSSAPIQSTNIAAGKPSLAFSQEPGFETGKANDADLATEWRSAAGWPQWLYIDFGASMTVDRAIVRWVSGMHATSYALYAWSGASWYPIYSTTRGTGVDEVVTFNATSTRYVLLNATAGPAAGVGLREFEIYEPRPGGGLPRPYASGDWWVAPEVESEGADLVPSDGGDVRFGVWSSDDEKAGLRLPSEVDVDGVRVPEPVAPER